MTLDGVLNIYKEKGYTSHDVVAVVRKTLNIKKVGHTGTLDPDAEGVLPVCIGRATKLADYIMNGHKSYRAEITFGAETTTEDASGDIVSRHEFVYDEDKIKKAAESFIGRIFQKPPMYSAVKVNGKKLYELAREGKEIERKSREIEIFDIKITEFIPPDRAIIEVDCSKGTYIRTLCSDIGKSLGWGAYMSALTRTASGRFRLENAVKLEELKAAAEKGRLEEFIIPPEKALEGYKKITVSETAYKYLYNGGRIYSRYFSCEKRPEEGETVLGYDSMGKLAGIYAYTYDKERDSFFIKPVRLML